MKYLLIVLLWLGLPVLAQASTAAANAEEKTLPPPSSAAQKLYAAARRDLLQVRVLLRNGRTQSTVGSGFLIGDSDLVVTNYHVVSKLALQPETYIGEYFDTNNQPGTLTLLAVDVLHDLAVVRVARKGTGFFKVPAQPEQLAALSQGQYIYSLGNPLDLGFAIAEGTYNGLVLRSFHEQIMFTGAINSGMSGGPNITARGELVGVNVSHRTDGELASFLVPARFVVALLNRVASQHLSQQPSAKAMNADIAQQLLDHQSILVTRLLGSPLTAKTMGPYQVPVRESDQVRCWGRSSEKPDAPFSDDSMQCNLEASIYVSDRLQSGDIAISHRLISSKSLDSLRFSGLISRAFNTAIPGRTKDAEGGAPACHEDFVNNGSLPLRAVVCVRSYRKFAGLYDFTVLTASNDRSLQSLQSRYDFHGVSYENGTKLTRLFIASIRAGAKP